MNCFLKSLCLGALFGVAALPLAQAERPEKYEIRAAAVSPDTLRIQEGGTGADALIQVRVKVTGIFTGAVRPCEAAVDFGDGTPPAKILLGKDGGMSNITDIPHTYVKTGRFVATISGSRSYNSCDGRVKTDVVVLGAGEAARPTTRRSTERSRDRSRLSSTDLELFDDITIESGRSPCPPGWVIVPGSQNGAYRFACKAKPVDPIVCQGGTAFFDNGSTIGCR